MRLRFSSSWIVYGCCALAASIGSAVRADESSGEPPMPPFTATQPGASVSTAPPTERGASETASSTGMASRRSAPSTLPVFPRPGVPAPGFTQPLIEPQVTNQTRQALGFYGGYAARTTLSQFPRRAPIQAGASQPMHRQIKPFNTVYREPTVSPYLNLYREESESEGAPNYFAFVRPQMEQIDVNRLQQRELQKLYGQLQGASSMGARPQYRATGLRRTSTPARYMDTAQFYGGWQR